MIFTRRSNLYRAVISPAGIRDLLHVRLYSTAGLSVHVQSRRLDARLRQPHAVLLQRQSLPERYRSAGPAPLGLPRGHLQVRSPIIAALTQLTPHECLISPVPPGIKTTESLRGLRHRTRSLKSSGLCWPPDSRSSLSFRLVS